MESRAYGYNSSFLSLGNFLGPIIGGLCAGLLSIRGVFLLSACLLLLSSLWMLAKVRRGTFDKFDKKEVSSA
jgi:DHA1 family multidrug resistance protein-like MFS transporter